MILSVSFNGNVTLQKKLSGSNNTSERDCFVFVSMVYFLRENVLFKVTIRIIKYVQCCFCSNYGQKYFWKNEILVKLSEVYARGGHPFKLSASVRSNNIATQRQMRQISDKFEAITT